MIRNSQLYIYIYNDMVWVFEHGCMYGVAHGYLTLPIICNYYCSEQLILIIICLSKQAFVHFVLDFVYWDSIFKASLGLIKLGKTSNML
jgi:hypothetical protein